MLAYLFMLPGALILLLFMAYPFFLGIWLSLTNKLRRRSRDYDFVGLDNYRWFWTTTIFRQSGQQHLHLRLRDRAVQAHARASVLALLLNERFHFSRFVRAGLLLPWIVPTAISSLAWLMLFDRRS